MRLQAEQLGSMLLLIAQVINDKSKIGILKEKLERTKRDFEDGRGKWLFGRILR